MIPRRDLKQVVNAVNNRRRGSDSDKRIHVRACAKQVFKTCGIKSVARDYNGDDKRKLNKRVSEWIVHRGKGLWKGKGRPLNHRSHCDVKKGKP